jgi:hypothetical protein
MCKVVTSVVPYFATASSGFSRWEFVLPGCPILFAYFAKGWVIGILDAIGHDTPNLKLCGKRFGSHLRSKRRVDRPIFLVKRLWCGLQFHEENRKRTQAFTCSSEAV